ncbi:expressed protein [Chlorella variabilis]|uniref:Expressed protein n=1 Tax=Chlorella variabilis TaxID=554065 RepID=E1ZBM2_CHLVA|nr:expressed protein [Chlorella variabilis]EFN56670.1 expressed protein [Chlorella variabilis]|eukprot:XP_005848772.1 expressed protein [Chlorella variabilis]
MACKAIDGGGDGKGAAPGRAEAAAAACIRHISKYRAGELDQQLQADLERLRQRQAATGAPPSAPAQQATAQQPAAASGGGPLEAVKDAVDKGKQLAEPGTPDTSPFWHPQACRAEEAAQALLEMHSGSSLESSLSEQLPLTSRGASPDRDPAAAAAPPPRRGGAQPAFPAPAPAAAAVPYPVYRPTPVHGAMDPTAGLLAPWFVAPAAAAPVAPALPLLPPAPRLRGGCPPPAAACGAGVDAGVLAQAHRWLASVLAQQEQERRYLEQYNHLLLLQAMQQEQARRRQQHTQRCTPAAAAMAGHCAGPLLA